MKLQLLTLTLFLSAFVRAQDLGNYFNMVDGFLANHVSNGRVDYKSIKSNSEDLNAILNLAATVAVDASDPNNYQAFWINAYNLATIKGVVNNYPIKSPLDISGFFDKTIYKLGGKQITLNDIENKILREKFKDPRVHFVLVCGAVGCPPLINKAYRPELLNAQLTAQTKAAINGSFIKINSKRNRVQVSQIMEWYKGDFIQNGTEIDFLNSYLKEKLSTKAKLSYFDYNWQLNEE